jgi:hypothetical protein
MESNHKIEIYREFILQEVVPKGAQDASQLFNYMGIFSIIIPTNRTLATLENCWWKESESG